jgi:uncharacterized protein YxeA
MKKILFMFLCLSFLDPLFAQSSYSSANQDTETNTEYVKENDPNDISSETDQESDKNELDEIERKTDQDNYEPENIPEEEENL